MTAFCLRVTTMRRVRTATTVLGAGILCVILLSSASAASISLYQAVEQGLQHNRLLQASTMETLAQKEEYLAQRGKLFPSLWFYEEATRSNNPPFVWMTKMSRHDVDQSMMNMKGFNEPPETTNYESRFDLRYPLFHGGSILAATKAKEAKWKANESALKMRRDEVALRVSEAYMGLLLAKAAEAAAMRAVDTARHHVEQATNRYRAGTALKSDVLQAKVFLAKMKDRLARARKNRKVAALRLRLEMGENVDTLLPSPRESLEELYKKWSNRRFDEEQLKARAKERGDVKAVKMAVLSAHEMEKAAKGRYFPSVDLMASAQWNGHTAPFDSDASSWMIGGRLSFNIFDGFQRRHRVSATRAYRLEHEARLERKEEEAVFQVESSLLALKEASQRVDAARESVAQAEEALRVVEKRYSNGLATVVVLNDTQTALEDARVLKLSAMHDYLVSLMEVLFSSNQLLDFLTKGEKIEKNG